MQSSNLPLRKWVIGFYLMSTNLKGVSSMKLHRDLKGDAKDGVDDGAKDSASVE